MYMIQQLLHLIGLCPDHFTHANILDAPLQDLYNLSIMAKFKLKNILNYSIQNKLTKKWKIK